MSHLPNDGARHRSLSDGARARERRVLGWRRYLPRRWRDMPFIYTALGPGGVLLGIDGVLYALGIEVPGFQVDPLLGGRVGVAFFSVLLLAQGALILLRHRAALRILWASLAFSLLSAFPGGALDVATTILFVGIVGLWAWANRGWFEKEWRQEEPTGAEDETG